MYANFQAEWKGYFVLSCLQSMTISSIRIRNAIAVMLSGELMFFYFPHSMVQLWLCCRTLSTQRGVDRLLCQLYLFSSCVISNWIANTMSNDHSMAALVLAEDLAKREYWFFWQTTINSLRSTSDIGGSSVCVCVYFCVDPKAFCFPCSLSRYGSLHGNLN